MGYAAFLSYSHADARWAGWLLRKLEAYRVPKRLIGTTGAHGLIGPRLGKMFRDRDELPTAGHLGDTIRAALADSDALIVICSPAATQSRWVNAEIQAFRALGRDDRIACFIVDGEPGDNASPHCCFPPAIVAPEADGSPHEPLAADARKQGDGRNRAFLKLVAGLLGVSYDALAQREAQRRHRRMLAVTTASVVGMAIAISLAVTAYVARNEAVVARNDAQRRQAQAEDIMGFMLGNLREKLTTVGRLDLMSTVDDKATQYFETLNPRDLNDTTLAQQAQSLTNIGQVRLAEGKHVAAMAAFREALERSSALYDRTPGNGQRLYDRAQAEYWIGFVGLQQGNFDVARRWFSKYRDSAIQLAAMDPENFEWQKEVAYGHHNLAVMDQKRGHVAAAEESLRQEIALYDLWLKQRPADLALRQESADSISWLASLNTSQGKLADAEAGFTKQVRMLQANLAAEPDNANWKTGYVYALTLLANAQKKRGRREPAASTLATATSLAASLFKQDPTNNGWRATLGRCHLYQSELETVYQPIKAQIEAAVAKTLLTAAHAKEPKSQIITEHLIGTRNQLALLAMNRGDLQMADTELAESQALVRPASRDAYTESESLRMRLAETLVLQAESAQRAGDASAAVAAWLQVKALLSEAEPSRILFARLDPLLRAQTALGDRAGAARSRQRLAAAGYQPLRPFAAESPVVAQ
ncbi:MAG: TIR domain-containing protein [Thermomonas sp.]